MQSFKLAQPVIGLDIGSGSVKMVQIKDAISGAQLLNFKLVELPLLSKKEDETHPSKGNTIEAIKESLKDFDTKLVKVISIVSGPKVSVRRVVLPPMPKREMLEAIKWEAKTHLPFPIEDSVVDFQILTDIVEKGVKKYELVVVCAEKSLIDEHLLLLKNAGIRTTSITAGPLCLWNLVKKGFTLPEDKVVALLNVGSEVTDINIFKGGSLQFTRQVLIAGMNITTAMTGILVSDFGQIELDIHQAEEIKKKWGITVDEEPKMIDEKISSTQISALIRPIVDRLINEIRRSFDYYREESRGQRVNKIILFGGSSRLKGFKELLSKGLGIEVEVGDPLSTVQISTQEEGLFDIAPRLAVVMGAALGGTKGINLIPFEIRTRARRFLQKLSLEVIFTIVIFFMLFNYIFIYSQLYHYKKRIKSSNIELATLQSKVRKASEIEEMRLNIVRRNSLITELTDKGFDWVNILKEISNIISSDVTLTSISLEEAEQPPMIETEEGYPESPQMQVPGVLKIAGKIISKTPQSGQKTAAILARFTANLEWSGYFKEVNLISASKDEGDIMRFEITCEMEP